jgi:CO/xanthine dehydrogenase Mo-binding subunit
MSVATFLHARISRRGVIKAGAAIGGGLLLGLCLPITADAADRSTSAVFAPNAFIRMDRQGRTTLIIPQVEMGQGIYTALAMILAEELDVTLDQVTPSLPDSGGHSCDADVSANGAGPRELRPASPGRSRATHP